MHRQAQELILSWRQQGAEVWINRQVLREFIVNLTRPQIWLAPLSIQQVIEEVSAVQTLYHIADDTELVTEQLLRLLQAFPTGGKQVHDANIVATMLVYGIDTLLTANVGRYEEV